MTATPASGPVASPSPRNRRLTPRRIALLASSVVALAGLALLALVPLQYWALAQQGFDAACSASVGGVPAGEGTLIGGSWSWWPLGNACEWEALDGTVLLDQPDWSTTAVAITGAALLVIGVVGVLLSLLLRRRAR